MGFPSSKHIQEFVRGKTIECLETSAGGAVITLRFTDGEMLRLVTAAQTPQRPGIETIATPFGPGGVVKQSAEILTRV